MEVASWRLSSRMGSELPRANCWLPPSGRTSFMLSFCRITDANILWCRIANPPQLKRCPYGQECLSRNELSWICNPAPLNIRICNPKYTVLTFFPHLRCSYSMVSDCKSDTTKHSLSRRELSRIAHRPMVACRKQEILSYFSSSRYCSMSMPRFLSVRSLLSHISR